MLLGAVALVVVGLGFKVGVVPFHFWAPDVYQGSPTSLLALMTVGIIGRQGDHCRQARLLPADARIESRSNGRSCSGGSRR